MSKRGQRNATWRYKMRDDSGRLRFYRMLRDYYESQAIWREVDERIARSIVEVRGDTIIVCYNTLMGS